MKVKIDRAEDALYLRLDGAPVIESERIAPGVIVDLDRRARVVGVEVLQLSRRVRFAGPRRADLAAPSLVREKPAKKYRA
ncbi:MAG TPA: DUF2283 domain-containing protein [Kiritimatiellia bacterium]|nr:DUF2283 domain-containing protein [Kiritimatiellia bacterium]HRZ12311.1 DUF2283 domain-containing protein [Kiritimatiellia bacterium]HSA17931.1 DUF2283 domain-containing protein [Kiritimatiellia bacterium]